jgi:hypothetical protein
MTELEKGILLVILKSQLQIETAVYDKIELSDYHAVGNNVLRQTTSARLGEIRRQINVLEGKDNG